MAPSSPVRSYVHKNPDEWKHDGWTACPNRILRDSTLSWELRALWCWMASHTEAFEITGKSIADAGPMGKNKSYEMIRELERRGLLTRHHELDAESKHRVRYQLHHTPVPEDQRTATPSKAQPRKKSPGFTLPAAEDDAAPEDAADQVPTHQGTCPDQQVPTHTGSTQVPGREVPAHTGTSYKEENTNGKDYGGAEFVDAGAREQHAPPPSTAPRCEEHAAIPEGDPVPACRKCAANREWWEKKQATAASDAAARVRACPMCDSTGHRLDAHRFPVPANDPMRVCDHTSPYQRPTEPVDIDPRPSVEHVPTSSAEARAAALAAARRRTAVAA